MRLFGWRTCRCGVLENAAKEPGSAIQWDERMHEYHIVDPKGGQTIVYYCPSCGGKTPKSRRESFFAHVTQAEESRIYSLFAGIRTVEDVIARFGPPDEEREFSAGERSPGFRGRAEQGEAFRGLVYKNLSPVADILFHVGIGETVKGTWVQKYVGKKEG